jgi:hypothetical protein
MWFDLVAETCRIGDGRSSSTSTAPLLLIMMIVIDFKCIL